MRRPALAVVASCLLTPGLAAGDEIATAPPTAKHAPSYSLWIGPRAAFLGFGQSFFDNDPRRNSPSTSESTGNFVGNGLGTQIDVGARLARRYVPYVFYEHGFMGQGHRFAGSDATSSTDSYGIGLRLGGADDLGFISDLSISRRVIRVSNGSETYEMTGLEVFKLALGAELRLNTLFVVDAMVSIAGGSLGDSSGDVRYGPEGNKDGRTHPDFLNHTLDRSSTAYIVLGLGAGIHFDLFGN